MIHRIAVQTSGQGLYEFTPAVQDAVRGANIAEGRCTVFVQHTSASLVIQENADPTAKRDLERWIARLVPEGDPFHLPVGTSPPRQPPQRGIAHRHLSR